MKEMRMKEMYLNIFKRRLTGIAIANSLLAFASIPVNLISASMLSDIILCAISGDTNSVFANGLKLVALIFGYKTFDTLSRISLERYRLMALHKSKMELYDCFLEKPLWELYLSENGQLKESLNDDFSIVTDKILSVYPGICTGIITGITYLIFILNLNWMVSIILMLIALIQSVPPIMVKKYFEKNYKDTRDIEAQLSNFIIEAHKGFAIMKLYDLKKWCINNLTKLHRKYLKVGKNGIYTNTAENVLDSFVSIILRYGTYAIVGILVLKSVVSIEVGVEVIALSGSFFAAVNTVFSSIIRLGVISEAENRLCECLVNDLEIEKKEVADNSVVLTDVSISYNNKNIFDCANIKFPNSGICLIKGANGIGKTTLFKLITGLIHSDQGTVHIGGVEPDHFFDGTFPWKLFYLPQEDSNFAICPRDFYKMLYGDNISCVMQVAQSFGLGESLLNDTNINSLSGGDRKKVFLSLAFAVDPAILLLDEPTNSLDDTSKKILIHTLKKRKGLTLIITHDPIFDSMCNYSFYIREGFHKT